MAECPAGYVECTGICHFRIDNRCGWTLPPKPIAEFRTTNQRIADLEAKLTELNCKRLLPEQNKKKPKFTGGINV